MHSLRVRKRRTSNAAIFRTNQAALGLDLKFYYPCFKAFVSILDSGSKNDNPGAGLDEHFG